MIFTELVSAFIFLMFEVLACVARDLEGSLNVKPPAGPRFSLLSGCFM